MVDRIPDLDVCRPAYLKRFDIEHTYRFIKQILGGRLQRFGHPGADRWT